MMVIIKIRLGLVSMNRSYFKLNRIPFAVKLYIGFALLVFLLMGITYLHAYIKRPEQMQSLQLYEQKLETISSKKVNEEYYVSGRASQNNNLEITYASITIDDIKGILSKPVSYTHLDVYKRQDLVQLNLRKLQFLENKIKILRIS